MRKITKYALTAFAPALLTACAGSYFNNLITIENHDAGNPALVAADRYGANARPAQWGECKIWRQIHIISDNDVDTAYNKLIRQRVVELSRVPQTGKNPELDVLLADAWREPTEQPGLLYVMPPRYTAVQVNDFNQVGVVAWRISKNNRSSRIGSFVDVEYCEGGGYDIGFYLPPQTAPGFETALRKKFLVALR